MREEFGLKIISEIRDATHADQVIEAVDIIQIGAKAMYDHGVLKKSGDSGKTGFIEEGFGTTLQEFVQAAEFVLSRGIRMSYSAKEEYEHLRRRQDSHWIYAECLPQRTY